MSGDGPPRGGHYSFTAGGDVVLGKWLVTASAESSAAVTQALMRVVDGTWCDHYVYVRDAIHLLTWHVFIMPGLAMSLRFAHEYPTKVQLIYIGNMSHRGA